jgi:hypothetical protein
MADTQTSSQSKSSIPSPEKSRISGFHLLYGLAAIRLTRGMSPSLVRASALQETAVPIASGVQRVDDPYDFIGRSLLWIVVLGLVGGVIFLIWGGAQYQAARDDKEKKWRAKKKVIV